MDYDLGEPAESLRRRLRQLVEEHLPEGFLGAFTDDPEDLAITQRFCKLLAAEGLLAKAWPTEYGGGGGCVSWSRSICPRDSWVPPPTLPRLLPSPSDSASSWPPRV